MYLHDYGLKAQKQQQFPEDLLTQASGSGALGEESRKRPMSVVRQGKCCSYNMVPDSSTGKSSDCQFDQTSLWLGLMAQLKALFWEARILVVLVISPVPAVSLCLAEKQRTCLGHPAFRLGRLTCHWTFTVLLNAMSWQASHLETILCITTNCLWECWHGVDCASYCSTCPHLSVFSFPFHLVKR